MNRAVIATAAMLLLAGCGGRTMYSKVGSTQADFRRDSYECDRDVAYAFPPGRSCNPWGTNECARFHRRCMEARGWETGRQ